MKVVILALICVLTVAVFPSCNSKSGGRKGQVKKVSCEFINENNRTYSFLKVSAEVIIDDSILMIVPSNQPNTSARLLAADKLGILNQFEATVWFDGSKFTNIEHFFPKK